MRRICLPVLLSCVIVVPAFAGPLQIGSGASSEQPNRGGGLGGGFIEFLAGGGAQRPAAPSAPVTPAMYPMPQAYQPAPTASQSVPPPRSPPASSTAYSCAGGYTYACSGGCVGHRVAACAGGAA